METLRKMLTPLIPSWRRG